MPDPAYEAKYGKGPFLAADAVVTIGARIALIRRRKDGVWALPGGIVEPDETSAHASAREFKEEAGVDLEVYRGRRDVYPPMVFDQVDRDPRGRIVSHAVLFRIDSDQDEPELIAGDDADDARWWDLDGLPPLYADHDQIIAKILHAHR